MNEYEVRFSIARLLPRERAGRMGGGGGGLKSRVPRGRRGLYDTWKCSWRRGESENASPEKIRGHRYGSKFGDTEKKKNLKGFLVFNTKKNFKGEIIKLLTM